MSGKRILQHFVFLQILWSLAVTFSLYECKKNPHTLQCNLSNSQEIYILSVFCFLIKWRTGHSHTEVGCGSGGTDEIKSSFISIFFFSYYVTHLLQKVRGWTGDRPLPLPPPYLPPQPRVSLIRSRSGESFVRANFPSLPFFSPIFIPSPSSRPLFLLPPSPLLPFSSPPPLLQRGKTETVNRL